jgi:hypothetical protein
MRRHVLSYFEMLAEPVAEVVTRKDIYGGQQLIGQLKSSGRAVADRERR